MIRIGLLWHSFSSNNLGVGALSIAHAALLRDACATLGQTPEFVVFGTRGSMQYDDVVGSAEFYELNFRRLVAEPATRAAARRAFARCDIVFDIGEGDSFTDIYGWKRFTALALSKFLVVRSGTPWVLAPQTIGPFRRRWNRWTANALIRRASAVFPRDRLSQGYLDEEKLDTLGDEAIDTAFRLPSEPVDHGGGAVHVGINVSGLLFNGGYTGRNQFALALPYADFVDALIRRFADIEGCSVHLVAHVISDDNAVEDDYRTICSLATKHPRVRIAPKFADPVAAKSYIGGLDFFTGARMHATIAAFSSGVPVVPVAYSRKFQGLYGTLGYPHVVDATGEPLDRAIEQVLGGYARRRELAEMVARGNREADRRLDSYTHFATRLLRDRRTDPHVAR